jgi:hypothetical protein
MKLLEIFAARFIVVLVSNMLLLQGDIGVADIARTDDTPS